MVSMARNRKLRFFKGDCWKKEYKLVNLMIVVDLWVATFGVFNANFGLDFLFSNSIYKMYIRSRMDLGVLLISMAGNMLNLRLFRDG